MRFSRKRWDEAGGSARLVSARPMSTFAALPNVSNREVIFSTFKKTKCHKIKLQTSLFFSNMVVDQAVIGVRSEM